MATLNKDPNHTDPPADFKRLLPLLAGLAGLVFILFFYKLGSYPLFDVDEPRYAEAAREMIERGNWITPYFNYELRFDKPVFFYWLVAIAYKLFGVSEFSARLFSAITAAATVFAIFFFGRFWVSTRFGLYAALMLATSLEVVGLARMSVTDMTLTAFMTFTTLSLFMAANHHRLWWLASGIFAGLAVLTKGPVGLVVPGTILLLYLFFSRQLRFTLTTYWPWILGGLGLCALISIPWYVLAYLENGQIFLDALFLHNMSRFGSVVSGHDQPIYFFVIVLLAGFLPWSAFLPVAATYWTKILWKRENREASLFSDSLNQIALYGGLWTVFVFLFFTVSQTKLLTYILPLFPGVALVMAATWYRAETQQLPALRRGLGWSAILLFSVFLITGAVFIIKMPALLPREAATVTANPMVTLAVFVLVIGTGLMAWTLSKRSVHRALAIQVATMGLFAVVALIGVVPRVNQATQGEMHNFLSRVGDQKLATYEIIRPSLTYYARRRVEHVPGDDYAKLGRLVKNYGMVYIITKNRFLDQLARGVDQIAQTQIQMEIQDRGPIYSLVKLQSMISQSGHGDNSSSPGTR